MALLYIVIVLVLIFDFLNGFHDSANSIATVVSTKVLSPVVAVSLAAFFNFIAFTVFPLKVAHTIGKGVVNPDVLNLTVIASALVAAIIWNLVTWWFGLPSSSSHTLVGGLVGAAFTHSGAGVIILPGLLKIIAFIFIAPILGMIMSFITSTVVVFLFRKFTPGSVDKIFRRLQILSSSTLSLGHGGNDAQKSMGIIWAALIVSGLATQNDPIALWIILSCQSAIALGTLFGGWRIVKTMGQKITKVKPFEGFCSETSGALTLFWSTHFGIPVSTTHTITGAIIGVGARKGVSAVKWGVTKSIFWAWMLTIPISAIAGSVMYHFFRWVF
ncbi:MAG: inorganic phosphate transporter [Bacteroidales bacterium]|jgi:PiT family inorganic phosphate transporter|nr:inorganic phosphate transporter [Bacteroidales bacterium]